MSQIKDRSNPFFKESTFKIAEIIFNSPNSIFHIRKLSKETKLSTTAVISSVKELKSLNIIQVEKNEITTDIKADLSSDSCIFYKRILNIYRLEKYGLIKALKDKFRPEAIVLFGSYAKGEDVEGSDIDLLVITKHKPSNFEFFSDFSEKQLKRKINLQILPSIEDSSKEYKNSIANGIVLYGYIKVV